MGLYHIPLNPDYRLYRENYLTFPGRINAPFEGKSAEVFCKSFIKPDGFKIFAIIFTKAQVFEIINNITESGKNHIGPVKRILTVEIIKTGLYVLLAAQQVALCHGKLVMIGI